MPPPVDPVTSPVTFPFENGAIKLVTVIDPVSGCHTVVYDLCDKSIPIGIYKALKLTKGTDLTSDVLAWLGPAFDGFGFQNVQAGPNPSMTARLWRGLA
jgi:hypothetical protein